MELSLDHSLSISWGFFLLGIVGLLGVLDVAGGYFLRKRSWKSLRKNCTELWRMNLCDWVAAEVAEV